MAKRSDSSHLSEGGFVMRFNIVSLVLFSVSLVLSGGLLVSWFQSGHARGAIEQKNASSENSENMLPLPTEPENVPVWGELAIRDITVERPEEYVAFESFTNTASAWYFDKKDPEQVRLVLLSCGLDKRDVDSALAPACMTTSVSGTVIKPTDALVLSLSPKIRGALYAELAHCPANHYMAYPFCFQDRKNDDWFRDSHVPAAVITKIKTLLYPRGDAQCFSDYALIMRDLKSDPDRITLLKVLSRQPAILARLIVRPHTDTEKLLGYWDRGIQVKDARPFIESLTRLPGGGSVSLLYLLPKFARERLYTFPTPPKPGDPVMDCHWSTMNFFNDVPDNRFSNPTYTVEYLKNNFYSIAKPNAYGDIIFFLDKSGNAIHSAVYLADDLVFTKNGNNYAQPWVLMRMKDLSSVYTSDTPATLAFYRNRGQ